MLTFEAGIPDSITTRRTRQRPWIDMWAISIYVWLGSGGKAPCCVSVKSKNRKIKPVCLWHAFLLTFAAAAAEEEWVSGWCRGRRVCFACSHCRVRSLVLFKNIYTAFYHNNVGIDHGLLSEWEKIFWPVQRCLETHWRKWIWTAVFDAKTDRILLTKLTVNPGWDHQLALFIY